MRGHTHTGIANIDRAVIIDHIMISERC